MSSSLRIARESRGRRAVPSALALAGLALSVTMPARAEPSPVELCIDAHSRMQEAFKAGKLLEARSLGGECTKDACPGAVRQDCATLAEEVGRAMPSVVFEVRDKSGKALPSASVLLDGVEAPGAAEGRSVDLDPGTHVARAELDGASVEARFVARSGGKRQLIKLDLASPAAPITPSVDPGVEGGATAKSRGGPPLASWVLGGVGVVALGGFGYFALSGSSKESDLDACTPRCNPDDTDAVKRDYLIADISLGVGVAALGAATFLWLSSSDAEASPAVDAARTPSTGYVTAVGVRPRSDGASLEFGGRF